MRLLLLLCSVAAALLVSSAVEPPTDCPPCYTMVEEAITTFRARLSNLAELLRSVGGELSAEESRQFERQLSLLTAIVEDLYNDARRAVIRDSDPLELLGDLQERIEEVKKVAGTIIIQIVAGRVHASQGQQTVEEIERILRRAEAALRETELYVETDGAEALRRAIEQSKQFGLTSARMSEIARQARLLAEEHERQARAMTGLAQSATSNASAAYELAYELVRQQQNFSSEMRLLETSLSSTKSLIFETRRLADQAQREAAEAYERALSLYSEAQAGFGGLDVDSLKRRAQYLRAEALRLKGDLEALSREYGPMLDNIDSDITTITILMERGLSQQQAADGLLADVTAARDKAEQAVNQGEATLYEARKTLETLLRFDRQVQESRDLATAALRQVDEILRMVTEAERKTQQARAALQAAERNVADARDDAAEAQAVAEEARQNAVSIQTESSVTAERASTLRQEAQRLNGQVSETSEVIERYEEQLVVHSALTREALEKANQAKSNAVEASARVDAALRMVREIMAALAAAGELDLATLEELERRLAAAEAELAAAQLDERFQELRSFRIQQDRMIKDYTEELKYLRAEVLNVQEIAGALPDDCFARVKLEP